MNRIPMVLWDVNFLSFSFYTTELKQHRQPAKIAEIQFHFHFFYRSFHFSDNFSLLMCRVPNDYPGLLSFRFRVQMRTNNCKARFKINVISRCRRRLQICVYIGDKCVHSSPGICLRIVDLNLKKLKKDKLLLKKTKSTLKIDSSSAVIGCDYATQCDEQIVGSELKQFFRLQTSPWGAVVVVG